LSKEGDVRHGALDIYAIEQDSGGNVLHQTTQRLNLSLTDQQYQNYLRSGILFHQLVQPNQGTTVLRVLVQDPGTSEIGSIIVPLTSVK
jgi:hypothetical protein